MNIKKKIALAAIPAVMALSATDASSKVLLMSDNGWEVSFDGAANAFYTNTSTGSMETLGVYNQYTLGGETAASNIMLPDAGAGNANVVNGTFQNLESGSDVSSISVGLLPNVWGFTVKAPTKNGLDVSGRLGLYTHMNANGNSADNNVINIRETSLTVAGSFGSVLMGRSLGIHQSNAILNDMTLFGVGVAAGNVGGTTLGRIGVGYVYADWYPQITWTTPGLGPIGAKIGILQATPLQSSTGADATETKYPRVEAQLDYSFELGGLGGYVWVDGQYQSLDRDLADSQLYEARNNGVSNLSGVARTAIDDDQADGVEVGGVGFGTRLTFQGFKLVASGFYNHGLGMQFQGNIAGGYSGSLDERGKARHFYGGYIQGTYDFGQGTNVGYSYGSNHLVTTGQDDGEINQRYTLGGAGTARTDAIQNYVESHMGMIWHNVTDDFRVIAEGVYSEMHWHGAGSQESTQVSVGAFFFW